jgi:uncharacterized protein
MTVVDDIGRSKYVSLTTYRKDGTGVATPVWHVLDGGDLFIVSDTDTGKVKRIRNNSQAVVTVCNARGQIAPGAPSAKGMARLLDEKGTQAARALIARKYVLSRVGNWLVRVLHLPKRPVTGIVVTF